MPSTEKTTATKAQGSVLSQHKGKRGPVPRCESQLSLSSLQQHSAKAGTICCSATRLDAAVLWAVCREECAQRPRVARWCSLLQYPSATRHLRIAPPVCQHTSCSLTQPPTLLRTARVYMQPITGTPAQHAKCRLVTAMAATKAPACRGRMRVPTTLKPHIRAMHGNNTSSSRTETT